MSTTAPSSSRTRRKRASTAGSVTTRSGTFSIRHARASAQPHVPELVSANVLPDLYAPVCSFSVTAASAGRSLRRWNSKMKRLGRSSRNNAGIWCIWYDSWHFMR